MKMPGGKLEKELFAPCGMNCMVCYRHCNHKKPCAGCLNHDKDKPNHCRSCQIKDCVQTKHSSYCYECAEYPCQRIRRLEKSYRSRYGASLMENSRYVEEHGVAAFMKQQKKRFTCPRCGGVISIHDAACTECQKKVDS